MSMKALVDPGSASASPCASAAPCWKIMAARMAMDDLIMARSVGRLAEA